MRKILSKEVTYYSKDRILPNNNIMDQFKADFIMNNWYEIEITEGKGWQGDPRKHHQTDYVAYTLKEAIQMAKKALKEFQNV